MKKIFAIALVFMLALSLAACGGGKDSGNDGGGISDPPARTDAPAAEAPKTDPPPQGSGPSGVPQKLEDGWPQGLPRYPGDEPEIDWDTEWVMVRYYGTTDQAAAQYLDTLKAAGWNVKDGLVYYGEAYFGEWYLNYSWDEPDFTMSLFWQQ